jgi:hypothetical protein
VERNEPVESTCGTLSVVLLFYRLEHLPLWLLLNLVKVSPFSLVSPSRIVPCHVWNVQSLIRDAPTCAIPTLVISTHIQGRQVLGVRIKRLIEMLHKGLGNFFRRHDIRGLL